MADWDRAYDAWALVYSRASAFFSLPDTVWFVSSLRFFASSLVTLAMAVDQRTDAVQKRKTTDAAGRLSKAAGMAGNDRSQARGSETKRAAVLMLANLSFKAYFKLNNTRFARPSWAASRMRSSSTAPLPPTMVRTTNQANSATREQTESPIATTSVACDYSSTTSEPYVLTLSPAPSGDLSADRTLPLLCYRHRRICDGPLTTAR